MSEGRRSQAGGEKASERIFRFFFEFAKQEETLFRDLKISSRMNVAKVGAHRLAEERSGSL